MNPTTKVAYDIGVTAAALLYVFAFVKGVQFFIGETGANDLRMLFWLAIAGLAVSAGARWLHARYRATLFRKA